MSTGIARVLPARWRGPETGTIVMFVVIVALGSYLIYPMIMLLVLSFDTSPRFSPARANGASPTGWRRGTTRLFSSRSATPSSSGSSARSSALTRNPDVRYRLRMEIPLEDDAEDGTKRAMPPLPTWKGGPFLVDVANPDELFGIFDEEDETLRPFFTREDPQR